MRPVATLVLLVALFAVPPAIPSGSIDDCVNAGSTGCQKVDVGQASQGHQQGIYYVYVNGTMCAPSFAAQCTGKPLNGAPVGLSGIVYQETNNVGGLQRFAITGLHIPADQAVLL
ncbi:MAG: hypothetical protein QOE90_2063 [Thermoplasmata archaeon]|jgi:hypothetical protein|nr:hypothetical protein [Thermoplasmata archaeon]